MSTLDSGWNTSHAGPSSDGSWEENAAQQVDVAIHSHYLHEYLPHHARILEVGAGAGRFTRELASISEHVTVVDVSESKLQRNQRNAQAAGYARAIEQWCHADVRELSAHLPADAFDAAVCYGGALGLVFDQREQAIRELARVVRPGGLLLLSARSLWGTLHANLPAILPLDPRINREIVASGDLGPGKVATASSFWHAYRADEFAALLRAAGLHVDALSASDCLSSTWGDLLLSWREDRRLWDHLIELELEACRQPGCLDMGAFIIAVAHKQ